MLPHLPRVQQGADHDLSQCSPEAHPGDVSKITLQTLQLKVVNHGKPRGQGNAWLGPKISGKCDRMLTSTYEYLFANARVNFQLRWLNYTIYYLQISTVFLAKFEMTWTYRTYRFNSYDVVQCLKGIHI